MKVKIITCSRAYNLGAVLQTYALQTYLLSQGSDAQVIDYNPDYFRKNVSYLAVGAYGNRNPIVRWMYMLYKFPQRFTDHRIFGNFRKKTLRTTTEYRTADALKAARLEADLFICGSDQIWCPTKPTGQDEAMYLSFVKNGKKAAYAASFGEEKLTDSQIAFLRPYLSDFLCLSVRENSGIDILKKAGFSCTQTVDPVFLLPPTAWNDFSQESRKHKRYGRYLLVYPMAVADPSFIIDAARKTAEGKKLELVVISKSKRGTKATDRLIRNATPADFVSLIAHASFIVTNSFHATAFSILFNKEFSVYGKEAEPNVRIGSLLRLTGLYDRYGTPDNSACFSGRPIDYTSVNRILDRQRAISRKYLTDALCRAGEKDRISEFSS